MAMLLCLFVIASIEDFPRQVRLHLLHESSLYLYDGLAEHCSEASIGCFKRLASRVRTVTKRGRGTAFQETKLL